MIHQIAHSENNSSRLAHQKTRDDNKIRMWSLDFTFKSHHNIVYSIAWKIILTYFCTKLILQWQYTPPLHYMKTWCARTDNPINPQFLNTLDKTAEHWSVLCTMHNNEYVHNLLQTFFPTHTFQFPFSFIHNMTIFQKNKNTELILSDFEITSR